MYQQYRRPPQQKSKKGAKILAILFVILILGGGLWYLSQLGQKVEQAETQIVEEQKVSITDNWFVGRKISLSGDMGAVPNEIAYTHTIKTSGGEIIKAFSSTRDLSSFQGQVFVRATVAKFDKNEYIIDIDAIGTSETELDTISVPTSNETKIIPAIGLKIDVTNRAGITHAIAGSTITLGAEGLSGNVVIEGFRCEAGFPEKDCDAIEKTFTEGSFVSAGGITYSKGPNNTWFAKNSAGAGYRVKTESDALLYKVSNALIPINENYIKNLVPQAQRLCSAITTLTKNTITKDTLSSRRITLDGKNSSGTDAQCLIRVTFTDSGESLTVEKQIGATTTSSKTGSSISTTIPTQNTGTIAPVVTASGLVFTSARGGYSITYPSAKIVYNGTNIQENLGIDKLNCYIRIDVKDYKDRENNDIGPAVSIYECTSRESSDTLASKASGYLFKTSADGTKLFFVKVLNSARNDFANNIKIQ